MRRWIWLGTGLLVACATKPSGDPQATDVALYEPPPAAPAPSSEPEPEPVDAPAASAPAVPADDEENPPPLSLPVGGKKLALGSACEQDQADLCGKARRVSFEFDSRHSFRLQGPPPCKFVRLPGETPGYSLRACVTDDRVYASSECMMCRMPGAGWYAVAQVDEMTASQRAHLQQRLHLPKQPRLSSVEQWQAAISDAATRATPGGLP